MPDTTANSGASLTDYAGAARLTSSEQEAVAFWRLRCRIAVAHVRQLLQRSRLRLTLVSALSVVFWVGLFALFYESFQFLENFVGSSGRLHADVVQFIFFVFFFSLMVMLMFSSGIILYSGLYRSPETQFLLTLPVRTERVVLHKLQEALLFSTWGFFLLGSPLLLAYGVSAGAPWYYYAMILPFLLSFAYIPCSVGAIVCLLVVHWIPRMRVVAVVIVSIAAIALSAFAVWTLLANPADIMRPDWFEETLSRLEFSMNRLLPSWWLSSGLLEAARAHVEPGTNDHPVAESIAFLSLLLSNAMFFHVITLWIGGRVFRSSFSGLYGEQDAGASTQFLARWLRRGADLNFATRWMARRLSLAFNRRRWGQGLDALVMRAARFLSYRVRLLIVKDLKVFRRDPVQWSQFLIFFGLLALYFVNIRRFDYDHRQASWVNMVSFLNLAVVGLILSTFTTRFIFPMVSLEGSRFWILGLLPIDRDTILWGKFLFSAVGSVLPCSMLILLSDYMLGVPVLIWVVHQLACVILCVGLSGIAVGLGAKMPDLREQSPSKIAAGFGGTLNLVLSAVYILLVVLLTALPSHFYIAAKDTTLAAATFDPDSMRRWLWAGLCAAVALGAFATIVPLRIGLRAFRELEF